MMNTTRESRFCRSSRESLLFFSEELLVTLFIWFLPGILLIRKLDCNPFYRFLRGIGRDCKDLKLIQTIIRFNPDKYYSNGQIREGTLGNRLSTRVSFPSLSVQSENA